MRAASHVSECHCTMNQEEDYEVINRMDRRSQPASPGGFAVPRESEVKRLVEGMGWGGGGEK